MIAARGTFIKFLGGVMKAKSAVLATMFVLCLFHQPSQAQIGYASPWGHFPQCGYGQQWVYQYPPGYAQQMGYGQQMGYVQQASFGGRMVAASDPCMTACQPAVSPQGYGANTGCYGMNACNAGHRGCGNPCADPCRPRQRRVFAEFLYLRPRNAEIAFAVPIDGPIVPPPVANPLQVGPVAIVDPDYQPGFRVGFGCGLDECSDLAVTYTHFESSTSAFTSIAAPDVIRSMVAHPSSQSAATDFLQASAHYGLDFDLVDLEYRSAFSLSETHTISYLVGVRYCGLQQDFRALFANNGTELVTTDITFDGGGIRLGLEGEQRARRSGLLVYGNTSVSFVAGQFKARFFQGQSLDPTVVDTAWEAGRIVTMLDLELGMGWASPNGGVRFTTGYLFSAWYNTVKTDEFINAVHANDFRNLGDTLTFDGLVARLELRY